MEEELYVDGLGIASGVVETIVSLATSAVEGVAGVGPATTLSGLRAGFGARKQAPHGIDVSVKDGALNVSVRVQVYYGHRLTEVADAIRETVADAVLSQVGVSVSAVDVFVDGVVFAE